MATNYDQTYNWWVGLVEEGRTKELRANNPRFAWAYEWPKWKLPSDFSFWSDGRPAYTDTFPLAGVILPTGLLTDVPRDGSEMATNKMVFPICKLGKIDSQGVTLL